ncbi:Forkhead box protein J1.2 [Trichinella sp. T6]|nr:Forkhead box protein J1.2 [Trichinella sp. T6]
MRCLKTTTAKRTTKLLSVEFDMQAEDDGLTNLSWLIHHQCQPLAPIPPQTPPPQCNDGDCIFESSERHAPNWQVEWTTTTSKSIDYKMEPIKPPYSYAQLIAMAMQAHGNQKVLLTNIYGWIRENFAYFRSNDTTWQNSVRHNLSLNKQFIKVPRDSRDKGKGSYWMLDPRMKDSYCLRQRNFGEFSSRKLPQPDLIRPQVNPAIRKFLQSSQQQQYSSKDSVHPMGPNLSGRRPTSVFDQSEYDSSMEEAAAVAAICDRFDNLDQQLCEFSDQDSPFLDFDDHVFKKQSDGGDYCPLGAQLFDADETDPNGTSVNYDWEPLQDYSDPGRERRTLVDADLVDLPLRIPTPEWWGNVNSANSLLMSPCASLISLPTVGSSDFLLDPAQVQDCNVLDTAPLPAPAVLLNSSPTAFKQATNCQPLNDHSWNENTSTFSTVDVQLADTDVMFLDIDAACAEAIVSTPSESLLLSSLTSSEVN